MVTIMVRRQLLRPQERVIDDALVAATKRYHLTHWQLEREQGTVPRAPGVLQYHLSVEDANGASFLTPLATLAVEQVTIRGKRRDRVADETVERYNLILIAYDRADRVAEHRRTLSSIRASIAPDPRVSVVGYTHISGDAEHNARLALERARVVDRELGLPEGRVEVRGETLPRFDQGLTAGRFHSRGVEIRTPVAVDEVDGG
ncbi:MAG TPA: hypothetical protein VNA88_09610 [Candidatus Kapabacteria bacterium]|jgi:outer membrane protein OmpA-like peptidoglycan-associated protein|nr:hypothetical protein [Candidatus Kapabacteria bacterium]